MEWKLNPMDVINNIEPEDNAMAFDYVEAFKKEFIKMHEIAKKSKGSVEIGMDDIYVAFLNGVKYAKEFLV